MRVFGIPFSKAFSITPKILTKDFARFSFVSFYLFCQFTFVVNSLFTGQISEVGVSLLEFLMEERKDVFVFFYDEEDGRAKKILQRLEAIDDNLVSFCLNQHSQSIFDNQTVTLII